MCAKNPHTGHSTMAMPHGGVGWLCCDGCGLTRVHVRRAARGVLYAHVYAPRVVKR